MGRKMQQQKAGPGTSSRRRPESVRHDDFHDAIVKVVRRRLPTDPNIRAVADELSINVRTLQRRLAETGLCYRHLLDDCRYQQAIKELRHTQFSISEIAAHLGYTDPAHFARAFRRWTGQSPRIWANRTAQR